MIRKIRDFINHRNAINSDKGRDEINKLLFQLWDILNEKGKTHADKYLNTCIYILHINRDIFFLYSDFYFEKNIAKKNLYGRHLSLTLIEYLSDINELIGRDMIQEIKINNWNSDLELQLKNICKMYSNLKNKFESNLREIRNKSVAHKTKNAKVLNDFYEKDFEFLNTLCPLMRLIEIEFENISMKFEEIAN